MHSHPISSGIVFGVKHEMESCTVSRRPRVQVLVLLAGRSDDIQLVDKVGSPSSSETLHIAVDNLDVGTQHTH